MEINEWPVSNRLINILVNNGIYKESDIPEYLEDVQQIPGMGPKTLCELREWLYQKYSRKLTKKPQVKKKKVKDFQSSREVVSHLIGNPEDWGRQIKMADSLVAKYGRETLLKMEPNPKVYSLAWYLTDFGDKYIRKNLPVTVVKEETKVEEIEILEEPASFSDSRPLTLKDFLKL
jgi:hypothetical protein